MSSHIARKDPWTSPDWARGPCCARDAASPRPTTPPRPARRSTGGCVTRTIGTRPISIGGWPAAWGAARSTRADETRQQHGGSLTPERCHPGVVAVKKRVAYGGGITPPSGRAVMSNVIRNPFATLTTPATEGGSMPRSRRRHSTSPRAWISPPAWRTSSGISTGNDRPLSSSGPGPQAVAARLESPTRRPTDDAKTMLGIPLGVQHLGAPHAGLDLRDVARRLRCRERPTARPPRSAAARTSAPGRPRPPRPDPPRTGRRSRGRVRGTSGGRSGRGGSERGSPTGSTASDSGSPAGGDAAPARRTESRDGPSPRHAPQDTPRAARGIPARFASSKT